MGARSELVFSLRPTDARPSPRSPARDSTKKDSVKAKPAPKRAAPRKPAAPDSTPFDLSVEVADAAGHAARLPLSRYGAVRRPLDAYVYLRSGRDKERFASVAEMVLQTYVIPLADFHEADAALDLNTVKAVRFVFDRTPVGTVVLDNVGFSNMSPDFLLTAEGRPR